MIYVGLVFLLGMSALSGWLMVKSVRKGIVYRPWPQWARKDSPILFWLNVGGLGLTTLASLAFAFLLLLVISLGLAIHN